MASWSAIARRIRVPSGICLSPFFICGWPGPLRNRCLSAPVWLFLGLVIRALASGHLQKNEQLATAGPYAYTRNPLYLGSLILAIGFALASRSWWIVAGNRSALLCRFTCP